MAAMMNPPQSPAEGRVLSGHTGSVNALALTANGQYALSGSSDNSLILWDLETGEALRTLEGHTAPVWGVGITPNERYAVSASNDTTLKLWDLISGDAL